MTTDFTPDPAVEAKFLELIEKANIGSGLWAAYPTVQVHNAMSPTFTTLYLAAFAVKHVEGLRATDFNPAGSEDLW